MIPILAGTRVTPFGVDAHSILVTIVGETISTFILIVTTPFSVALVETGLAFAQTLLTERVLLTDTV